MKTMQERFWAKVDKNGPEIIPGSPCWIWTGAINSGGYGSFGLTHSEIVGSNRAAYLIQIGDIPEGAFILHKCDNRPCVRGDHLYPGDHKRNMLDKKERHRARSAKGDDHWLRQHPERAKPFNTAKTAARGARNGNSSISTETACDIVSRVAAGESAYAVAKALSVSFSTVCRICHGDIRASETDPALRLAASTRLKQNPRARKGLSEEQRTRIFQLSAEGVSQAKIGRAVGVSQTMVQRILSGNAHAGTHRPARMKP